jgi:threonine synthase
MQYYSTNGKAPFMNFKDAAIAGLAPDGGLFFPEKIPVLHKEFFSEMEKMSTTEIAYTIMHPYVGDCLSKATLLNILEETFDFPIPLKKINPNQHVLELFHGNTLAFKDVGARFMSRCLSYFVKGEQKKMTVLVATSGDTGGAVADGFYGVEGVEVVILFPSGKVSAVQEKQLTAMGGNIHAIEIDGDFDDCQRLVKQAFSDADLRSHVFLTSANSINVARWIPQQLFYFLAYKQWPKELPNPVISIPSGNFGNICAGLLAKKSGLPIPKFIAACNENDVVPRFLENGKFEIKKTVHTISNAMDVGSPSNFIRILELYAKNVEELKQDLVALRFNDVETKKIMLDTKSECDYLLDPHGAVGLLALQAYQQKTMHVPGIFAATAHPVKFFDVVEEATGLRPNLPPAVTKLMERESVTVKISPVYVDVKNYLLDKISNSK